MTISKRIITILLAVVLAFSSLGISAYSYDSKDIIFGEQWFNPEEVFVQLIESISNDIINKIKEPFIRIYDFFCELFGIGYADIDISQYTEDAFAVPGLDTDFVPQGICYVEILNKFAISGYMSGKTGESRIYLVDPETDEYKYVSLKDFFAHAGGIASNGNDIWVSSGGGLDKDSNTYKYGKVYHITAETLETAENGSTVEFDGYFKTEVKGSFAYASDDMLWVGEFYTYGEGNEVNPAHYYKDNHAIVCGYKLPLGESVVPDVVLSIPDKVQGMATDADGNLFFSTSYGRHNNSALYIFENYNKWNKTSIKVMDSSVDFYTPSDSSQLAKIKAATLMEGIDYVNGQLYILFESGAKAYSDADEIITDVWKTDIDLLLNTLD